MDVAFLGTLLFYLLSLLHISLALIGLICAVTPFLLHALHRDKRWCRSLCPRASLFTTALSRISIGLRAPGWLLGKVGRVAILIWFFANFTVALMSTIMVAAGRVEPMAHVRFLLAFRFPFELPQLLTFSAPDFVVHFGYRLFSLMSTSTMLGLGLGVLFRPRSWCAICPIATLTPLPKRSERPATAAATAP